MKLNEITIINNKIGNFFSSPRRMVCILSWRCEGLAHNTDFVSQGVNATMRNKKLFYFFYQYLLSRKNTFNTSVKLISVPKWLLLKYFFKRLNFTCHFLMRYLYFYVWPWGALSTTALMTSRGLLPVATLRLMLAQSQSSSYSLNLRTPSSFAHSREGFFKALPPTCWTFYNGSATLPEFVHLDQLTETWSTRQCVS